MPPTPVPLTPRRLLSLFLTALAVTFVVMTLAGALGSLVSGGDAQALAVPLDGTSAPPVDAGADGADGAGSAPPAGSGGAAPGSTGSGGTGSGGTGSGGVGIGNGSHPGSHLGIGAWDGIVRDDPTAGRDLPDHGEAAGGVSLRDRDTSGTSWWLRLLSLLGILVYVGVAVALSSARRAINWRLVGVGMGLQLVLGLFILRTPVGAAVFAAAGAAFGQLLEFTKEGNKLLFGSFAEGGEVTPSFMNFAFDVLPTIIFFSSLMSILYHAGLMQRVVGVVAWAMRKTMQTSGAETLSAAANIFVGQTEAPLMVKPYVGRMTMSELMAIMTGGFATVAGGVMASYIGFLRPTIPDIAEHLLAASVMSAPAALVMAKIMQPEVDTPETRDGVPVTNDSPHANLIDAAANGAGEGLKLALNVGAMLLAFVALVAMGNYLVAVPSYIQHGHALGALLDQAAAAGLQLPAAVAELCDTRATSVALDARLGCIEMIHASLPSLEPVTIWSTFSLETFLSWAFWPLAFFSGVPFSDVIHLAELYGQKTVLNEFYAYVQLAQKAGDATIGLSARTVVIASYGLCGFANLSSIAIQIGGIGGIAPERRTDLAKIGIRAMIAGTLAAWCTGNLVGILM